MKKIYSIFLFFILVLGFIFYPCKEAGAQWTFFGIVELISSDTSKATTGFHENSPDSGEQTSGEAPGMEPVFTVYSGITIIGAPDFIERITDALSLMKTESPAAYNLLAGNVDCIREHTNTEAGPFEAQSSIYISRPTAFHSVEWAAIGLAHESYHCYLYHSYRKAHLGESVPFGHYGSIAAEKKCIAHEYEVAQQIGAPLYILEYIESQDGTHSDYDGDGIITQNDLKLRNRM